MWLKDYYKSIIAKELQAEATVWVSSKADDDAVNINDFDEGYQHENLRIVQGFQKGMAEKNE